MQAKALDRWEEVEKLTGEKLLQENGLLFYGEDTGETVEGSVEGARQVMEKLNLPHRYYATGDEIADAYPVLEGCRGKPYSGVCEDTAGHIRASKGEAVSHVLSFECFVVPSLANSLACSLSSLIHSSVIIMSFNKINSLQRHGEGGRRKLPSQTQQ